MRYIIVSPNHLNDNYVRKIAKLRCEFMQNARIVNDENEPEKMEVIDFVCNQSDYYNWDERKILDGTWKSMQYFNEEVLPNVRKTLLSVVENKERDVVHVDLGKSLLTLYIAYFAVQEGIATNITFHMPNPEDEKPVFNIGGDSAYSNPRNNLRRHISSVIMQKAMMVFIDNPAIAQVLNRLFPRINREIHIDPMCSIEPEEEKELQNVTN